ncbi:MAG: UDP-N-acetylmuramoyl-L-alanyl-D-glutamate--2,6-diaminopimelate ligase [Planctomycetota bacterium]|jgi:UDP-N-acetylmuramoyl-L-alanyl-D-glutamate--2,6-diaminopimelate ligase
MTFQQLLTLVSSNNTLNICTDSRKVKPGDIFIALDGTEFDGHDFIDQAIDKGAKFIVAQKYPSNTSVDTIIVPDSAHAAALLAQTTWQNPASKLINLAVTGTNGKTTVAFLTQSIINTAGEKCGLIGTVLYDTGSGIYTSDMTTPDCLDIAEKQSQMVQSGLKYMAIEASSHALKQNRLDAINFKAAAFTNLAGDHLDYHKTKDDYLASKAKLFQKLDSNSVAILNKQSTEAHEIAQITKADILWYAIDEPADIIARTTNMDADNTVFDLEYNNQTYQIQTSLTGRYNIANCLAAAGLAITADFSLNQIAQGLAAIKTIPGRLERIDAPGFSVFIDYAHTDDALQKVLQALKPICKGKLVAVFGCGGDRDTTKRPRMARVTEELADDIIVTSDNPRTEDPIKIIDDIITGFENPNAQNITIEPDRKKAIKIAIEKAQAEDIVLIAGKGHETYQIIGKQKFDFNDKTLAQEFISRLK